MYKILHPSNIVSAWPSMEPWLSKAVDEYNVETDLEVIKQDLIAGTSMVLLGYDQLTLEMDLVLVCEPRKIRGVPVLVIMWAAGKNMDSWLIDIALVENFAASRGFKEVQIWGRPGWAKLLKPEYRVEFIALSKRLNHGVH